MSNRENLISRKKQQENFSSVGIKIRVRGGVEILNFFGKDPASFELQKEMKKSFSPGKKLQTLRIFFCSFSKLLPNFLFHRERICQNHMLYSGKCLQTRGEIY